MSQGGEIAVACAPSALGWNPACPLRLTNANRRHVSQAPQLPDRAAEAGRGCSCEAEGAPIPSRSTLSVIRSVDVHGCAPTSGGSTECQAPVTRRGLEEEPRGVGRTASGPCCIRRPVQTPQPLSAEAVCVRRDVSRNRPKPSKATRFGLPRTQLLVVVRLLDDDGGLAPGEHRRDRPACEPRHAVGGEERIRVRGLRELPTPAEVGPRLL